MLLVHNRIETTVLNKNLRMLRPGSVVTYQSQFSHPVCSNMDNCLCMHPSKPLQHVVTYTGQCNVAIPPQTDTVSFISENHDENGYTMTWYVSFPPSFCSKPYTHMASVLGRLSVALQFLLLLKAVGSISSEVSLEQIPSRKTTKSIIHCSNHHFIGEEFKGTQVPSGWGRSVLIYNQPPFG